ncbi:hypothetical protein [Bradyrhizobium ganzhouense]|uniref:hypothetical protein n=1 Tax=Bradyrhizobium ganzhouense TaxID=1179767 RepID=UPI003CE7EE8D
MINLSNGGANEDGIFLHADVKAAHVQSRTRDRNKNAKTTPCTVAGMCENNHLRIIRNKFDTSGKTGAGWHDGGLELAWREAYSTSAVIPREGGESSIPETSMHHTTAAAYWIARLRGR